MPRVLTPALQEQVVTSGQIEAVVDVFDVQHGDMLLSSDPANVDEPRMKIVGGSLVTDEARAVQGTGTAKLLVDPETAESVLPLVQGSGLSPTAPARIHVKFRAAGDDRLTDYGVYEVDIARVTHSGEGVVMDVEVSDNSRRVERARIWRPITIALKTPHSDALHTLLDDVLPEATISIEENKGRTGKMSLDVQADRLSVVRELVTAISMRFDWNADGKGNVDIFSDFDIEDEPTWDFTENGTAKLISAERLLTDERTYNGVIAMGESTGSDKPPVRAEWWDTNPRSPTYFDPLNPDESSYGPVPFFYVSEFITNKLQALLAAKARLPKVLGLVEIISVTCVPHPGIVPGDTLLINDTNSGIEGIFVTESVQLPLTGAEGRMTIQCRDRRIVE